MSRKKKVFSMLPGTLPRVTRPKACSATRLTSAARCRPRATSSSPLMAVVAIAAVKSIISRPTALSLAAKGKVLSVFE